MSGLISRAGPSLHARLEDGSVGRKGRNDLGLRYVGRLNCGRGGLEVSDNTLERRQGITRLGTGCRSGSARVRLAGLPISRLSIVGVARAALRWEAVFLVSAGLRLCTII